MEPADAPQLVDPRVSARKVARELEQWDANAAAYRRRGWLMVDRAERSVDIAFTTKVAFVGQTADVVCAAVRIDFANYDLWPPSVRFIDVVTGEAWMPPMRAFLHTVDGPRDLLLNNHPDTHLPFLCVPGTREYHTHPQHSGDDWLLHRHTTAGRLAPLCDLLWRTMAQTVIGVQTLIQTLPGGAAEVQMRIVQGDPSQLSRAPDIGPPL